jgi:prepilin signal peptidase PulO-like enzyme (type II secretory pathway)
VTTIALIGPWQLAFPLFCLALALFRLVNLQVATLLSAYGHLELTQSDQATIKRHIWLHAMVMTIFVMVSPQAKLFDLLTGLIFFFFVFRLSMTDCLTGWLPQELTWSLLLAGLLTATGHDALLVQAVIAFSLLIIFLAIRHLGGHYAHREVLGLGDVWLIAGLGAWLSLSLILFTLLTGFSGFVLWHFGSQERSRGGPLGPWLGYSALVAMTISISDPLLIG